MVNYESFNRENPYSLDPGYGEFTGYRIEAGSLGIPTDVRTSDQVRQVASRINTGAKIIDMAAISPQVFETIPKQHFKEMARLAKMSGVDMSVHGILAEPSGFTQQGWSETNRESVERQLLLNVEKSKELSPSKEFPITFHTSSALPEMEQKIMTKEGEKIKEIYIINPRTGATNVLRDIKRPFENQGEFNPEEELKRQNKETWQSSLSNLNIYSRRGDEVIHELTRGELNQELSKQGKDIFWAYGKIKENKDYFKDIPGIKEGVEKKARLIEYAKINLVDSYNNLKEMYNLAYDNASEEEKQRLNEYAKTIKPIAENIQDDPSKLNDFSKAIDDGITLLGGIQNPKIFIPMNDFVKDKSSTTFSNVAYKAFKNLKPGESMPLINIENPPADTGLSRAQDQRDLIVQSREKLIQKFMQDGDGKSEAKQKAEKLIGATWDVGHIYQLRKHGYKNKDIAKEAKIIAPFVKHVHLSDNLGFENVEMPMGMGDVNMKEQLKALGEKGRKAKKIIEAGNWYQPFQTIPIPESLEALGSPAYATGGGPYWNQIQSLYGNYSTGYGEILPEQHFSLYGSGWSGLPVELGGQMGGGRSRFGGTPTE